MGGPPLSAPADCPVHPLDRYGLLLLEEPAPQSESRVAAERSSGRAVPGSLQWFDWGMLTCFAVVQLSYLAGLAFFARWAVRHWLGA